MPLLEDASTVGELRELVVVRTWIEQALRVFARVHPEEANLVDRTLMFRKAALEEFNRLVRDGVKANPEEIEETESEEMVLLA